MKHVRVEPVLIDAAEKTRVRLASLQLCAEPKSHPAISQICRDARGMSMVPSVQICGEIAMVSAPSLRSPQVANAWLVRLDGAGEPAQFGSGVVVFRGEIEAAFSRCKHMGKDSEEFKRAFREFLSIPESLSSFAEGLINECVVGDKLECTSAAYIPAGDVLLSPDSQTLIISGQDVVVKIPLPAGTSPALSPAIVPRVGIDDRACARDPELEIAIPTKKAWPLRGGKLSISCADGQVVVSKARPRQPLIVTPGVAYAVDRTGEMLVVASEAGKLTEYSLAALERGVVTSKEIVPGEAGNPCSSVAFDPTGQVIIKSFQANGHGGASVSFVAREGGRALYSIATQHHKAQLGPQGGIFIGDDGEFLSTNLPEFIAGLSADPKELEAELNNRLMWMVREIAPQSAVVNADIPPAQLNAPMTPAAALTERFRDPIAGASKDSLNAIRTQIEDLKRNSAFSEMPYIFQEVDELLAAREVHLAAEARLPHLERIAQQMQDNPQVGDVITAKKELEDYRLWRGAVAIEDAVLLERLDAASGACFSAFKEAVQRVQAPAKVILESREGECIRKLGFARSRAEIDAALAIIATDDYRQVKGLIQDERFLANHAHRCAEAHKRSAAQVEGAAAELKTSRDESARKEEQELRNLCGQVLDSLARVGTAEQLELWFKTNKLYQALTRSLAGASPEISAELGALIKKGAEDKRRTLGALGAADLARFIRDGHAHFGSQKLPVFHGYSALAIPSVIPKHLGSPVGNLRFSGIGGMTYQPEVGELPIGLDHPTTKAAIEKFRGEAVSAFAHRVRVVPISRPTWRVTEWVEKNLEKIAWAVNLVQRRGQGLVILESEPGLGKNILLEMLACATNRELLVQPFNKGMTLDDLTFMATLNNNNTELVPAKFFNYIQTPGALVFLDEFSAASDGLQKKLNALFTQDRTLAVSFGDDAKADPSTIFIAAINPFGTGGTNALNQDLKSRSIRVRLSMPPLKVDNRFTSDEAEIIYQYVDALRELTNEQFRKCWNKVTNRQSSSDVDKLLTPQRMKAINNLHIAIKVANQVRDAAKHTAQGASVAVPITTTWGMREQEFIAAALNYSENIQQVMEQIVLPNIEDPVEEAAVRSIIVANC